MTDLSEKQVKALRKHLSDDQAAFARRMSDRQWIALRVLANCDYYLSVSERIDPEMRALMRTKLARAQSGVLVGEYALPMWGATDAGKAAVRLQDAKLL